MKTLRFFLLICAFLFTFCACHNSKEPFSSGGIILDSSSLVVSENSFVEETSTVDKTSSKPVDSSVTESTSSEKKETAPSSSKPDETQLVDNSKYNTDYFTLRDGLNNSFIKLAKGKKLTIAFLGGSITYGVGTTDVSTKSFRVLVKNWLQESFSGSQIIEINAAIPSACSALGAYCVESDVLSHNPDVVFVEYALNDSYASSKYSASDASRNIETIIRKIKKAKPDCDIVLLYTTDSARKMSPSFYETAAIHEEIAEHYSVMSINMGWQLRRETGLSNPNVDGALSQKWLAYFADACHATDRGNQKYAEIICKGIAAGFTAAKENGGRRAEYKLPREKNANLLMNVKYIKTDSFDVSSSTGWKKESSQWKDFKEYGKGYIYTDSKENELVVTFSGTSFGILGPTNLDVLYSIDGKEWQNINFNSHPTPLVSGLKNGEHIIKIKVQDAENKAFSVAAFLIG